MTNQKVSELTELAAGDLDPSADWLLVSDMSALTSKKMKPSEMIRASLPYISTFWDFTTGTLLPTVSFTRASTGWRRRRRMLRASNTIPRHWSHAACWSRNLQRITSAIRPCWAL